jgi:formylglycine-generating enzyme required for sulfatase activity
MKGNLTSLLCLALLFLSASSKLDKNPIALKKALTDSFVYVPSGNAILNEDTVSVQAFYMYQTEVKNIDYQEFIADLKKKGDQEKLRIALVDSSKWSSNRLGKNSAYETYYHSHPAYRDFPVVNVSHEAAALYCQWLGEKYDEKYGTKGRFLFRLMEKAEYVRASRGDSDATYAWGTHSLRNEKGQLMCNHAQLCGENIHRNTEKNTYEIRFNNAMSGAMSHADVLATAKSYWPNQFKVYNLNGNAAEMIREKGVAMGGSWQDPGYDVRIESTFLYDGPNPFTGFRVVITAVENW